MRAKSKVNTRLYFSTLGLLAFAACASSKETPEPVSGEPIAPSPGNAGRSPYELAGDAGVGRGEGGTGTATTVGSTQTWASDAAVSWNFYQGFIDRFNQLRDAQARTPMVAQAGVTQDANGTWIVEAPTGYVLIENKTFSPRAGQYALRIRNATGAAVVEVRNCSFRGGNAAPNGGASAGLLPSVPHRNGWGVWVENSSNIQIHDNFFENIEKVAVEVYATPGSVSNNVAVFKNRSLNMQAADVTNYSEAHKDSIKWESKFIQFFNVRGAQHLVWQNSAFNQPGWSFSTDFINLYQSSGTTSSPLKITDNRVLGPGEFKDENGKDTGAYHQQGAGIQLGDHSATESGGSYVEATFNELYFPGRAGMNINGGHHMKMSNNTVVMPSALWGYNMYDSPDGRVMIRKTPWTAMSIHNYHEKDGSGAGLDNADHVANDNRLHCSTCDALTYKLDSPAVSSNFGAAWSMTSPVTLPNPTAFFP
jgi:hypothetical protein